MSESPWTESCLAVKTSACEDSKERIVDIYVSAESLKVFKNPWVEDTQDTTLGALGSQEPGTEETHTPH